MGEYDMLKLILAFSVLTRMNIKLRKYFRPDTGLDSNTFKNTGDFQNDP